MICARFVTSLLLVVSVGGTTMASAAVPAVSVPPGFALVPTPPAAPAQGKVEVIEFFWYGCPYCHRFEPQLNNWLATRPDYVDFVRIPAVLRPGWAVHARTYYTAEALGLLEQVHLRLFEAILTGDRALNDETELARFFAEQGVDRTRFQEAYHSPEVNQKVHEAALLTRRYGVNGVPTIVVNGKYRTNAELAGGLGRVMEIVRSLIAREHKTAEIP